MTTQEEYRTLKQERAEREAARKKRAELLGDLAGFFGAVAMLCFWLYIVFFL